MTLLKTLTVWITTNCGKFLETEIPDHLTYLLRNLHAVQEAIVWNQTGSKLKKEFVKAKYCHSVYLTYMQSTCCKMPGWMKFKLESRLLGEILIMAESKEELKTLLMKVKDESENAGLKLMLKKTKIMASSLIISWQIDGEKMETVNRLYFLGLQNHCRW